MMKVAVLLPTWVGDTCMATPTLRAIRHGIPQIEELCAVGRYAPVSLLAGLPWIDSSLIYKPRAKESNTLSRRGLVSRLKQKKFDMIILLPNSLSAGIIGYLSRAKRRVGYMKDGRNWLLTDPIPQCSAGSDFRKSPAIDYYLNIAKRLGCPADDRRMELAVSEQDRQLAESFYCDQGLSWTAKTVLFNTSSATAESRLWPVGHASRAARELATKHGIQVVVHCGPSDRERANAVAFGAAHPMVRSMGTYEHLPIGLSKGVIEHADVVVSTDSGPRHMAVALNRPVVSLFGPTSPKTTQTYNSPETILQLSMDCRPCGQVKCPLTHNNCMHGLTYPAVVKAILSRMDIPSYSEKPGGYSEEPGSARLKLPTA